MAPIDRHRDETSELNRRHGGTHVRTLRAVYGGAFAPGFAANAKLSEILLHLDQHSLQRLAEDQESGRLSEKIEHHAKAPA